MDTDTDEKAQLLERHPEGVWDTQEMTSLFDVHSFLAPFVMVTRKSDGVRGSLEFQHRPRFYFNFAPDRKEW